MVKAIIFDCFGVLTTDHWRAFVDSLPDRKTAARARELNHQYDAGLIPREQFLAEVKEATGRESDEIEAILWEEIVKNEALLSYIRELRTRGYKIGLISNVATNWIRDVFLTAEEQSLFDEMILSFEVGMTKPDPRIFMLICERLRVGPHEAILVDDIERYCTAARAEGLQAIVYQDLKQTEQELENLLTKRA